TARRCLRSHLEWFISWLAARANAGITAIVDEDYGPTRGLAPSDNAGASGPRPASRSSFASSSTSFDIRPGFGPAASGLGPVPVRSIVVGEVREMLLDALVQLLSIPGFMREVWVNYDGNEACQGHMFEELTRFLCKKRLDEALRLLLESFRLPGEAQQIERVVENFAGIYYESVADQVASDGLPIFADASSAFVLAFSVILLNTDQHNPQVRRRMTREDFRRNNRACNGGRDFDPEYLSTIYDAIAAEEIVMPEEHDGDLGFEYAWRELAKRAQASSPLILSPEGDFERDMFAAVGMPVIAAFAYMLDNAEDALTLHKATAGLH
ncbi:GDP/GTP exchange factor for ARF, partial [Cladochytrium tenue]